MACIVVSEELSAAAELANSGREFCCCDALVLLYESCALLHSGKCLEFASMHIPISHILCTLMDGWMDGWCLRYPAINKPAGVVHWLNYSEEAKHVDWVVILDADQILRYPLTPWEVGAERGKPVAARYGCVSFLPFNQGHVFLHVETIVIVFSKCTHGCVVAFKTLLLTFMCNLVVI